MAQRPYSIATRMPALRRDNRGRKQRYLSQQMMEVWLYVQVGKARTGLSALKFCERRKFQWLEGGHLLPREKASQKTGGLLVTHMVHGKTLRRRYQEAVAILRAESKPYRRLFNMGVRSSVFGAVSPTEEWWQRELKARLAGG